MLSNCRMSIIEHRNTCAFGTLHKSFVIENCNAVNDSINNPNIKETIK